MEIIHMLNAVIEDLVRFVGSNLGELERFLTGYVNGRPTKPDGIALTHTVIATLIVFYSVRPELLRYCGVLDMLS